MEEPSIDRINEGMIADGKITEGLIADRPDLLDRWADGDLKIALAKERYSWTAEQMHHPHPGC